MTTIVGPNNGVGDDTLYSANEGDVLDGRDGVDTLTAQHNNVTLLGGAGGDLDQLTGDALYSVPGVNGTIMEGGAGLDFLYGNGANDTASYANAQFGVEVDLLLGGALNDGDGAFDSLFGIENVTGSDHIDTLTGDAGANVLEGGAGGDTLAGGLGDDVFKFSFVLQPGSDGGNTPLSFGVWLDSIHALNIDNLHQNEFVQNYKEWLGYVAEEVRENHVFDTVSEDAKVSFKQNDPAGTPKIEGLTQTQLDQIFVAATPISVKTGKTWQDRYYSDIKANSDVWGSSGDPTVSSGDGVDTIVDFGTGADKLQFDFTAESNWAVGQADPLAYLESFFNIDRSATDTRLYVDMNNDGTAEWSVVLENNLLTDSQVFAAVDIIVVGTLIG